MEEFIKGFSEIISLKDVGQICAFALVLVGVAIWVGIWAWIGKKMNGE